MAGANDVQVGGDHYKVGAGQIQLWDLIYPMGWDPFQKDIIWYVHRFKLKNGVVDLKKARHLIDKLIEIEEAKTKEITT